MHQGVTPWLLWMVGVSSCEMGFIDTLSFLAFSKPSWDEATRSCFNIYSNEFLLLLFYLPCKYCHNSKLSFPNNWQGYRNTNNKGFKAIMDLHLQINSCCWEWCVWWMWLYVLHWIYIALLAAFLPTRPCRPRWQHWTWVHIFRLTSWVWVCSEWPETFFDNKNISISIIDKT